MGKVLRWFVLCGMVFLTACVGNAGQSPRPTPAPSPLPRAVFQNPLNTSGPDPWMTFYEGNYYLASTTWGSTHTAGLTMRKAPTIAELKTAEAVKIWQDLESMNCCNYWAPEFFLLDGPNGKRWYGYYTGGPSNCCEYQHLNVIESEGADPMGPYTYKAKLDDEVNRWAIDGSLLFLDGKQYLLYSAFAEGRQGKGPQNMYIAPMSDPWTLSGPPALLSTPTLAWETSTAPVNEGPVALQREGKTFIIYSANGCWGPNYALGMLTYQGGDPLQESAWKKSPEPVFKGTDKVFSPGHNTFFQSPDGTEDWIVYHANDSAAGVCDMKRTPRIQKFTWNEDGTPNLGSPAPPGELLAVPAGEKAP